MDQIVTLNKTAITQLLSTDIAAIAFLCSSCLLTLLSLIAISSTNLPTSERPKISCLTQRFKRRLPEIYSAIQELFYGKDFQNKPMKARFFIQKKPAKELRMVIHGVHCHLIVSVKFAVSKGGEEDQERPYKRFATIFRTTRKGTK